MFAFSIRNLIPKKLGQKSNVLKQIELKLLWLDIGNEYQSPDGGQAFPAEPLRHHS